MNDNPNVPFAVIRWAAQECEWQRSGERSVGWMIAGWVYAKRNRNRPVTVNHILNLGYIVEPRHNLEGFRKVGVRVDDDIKMHSDLVPDAIDALVEAQHRMSPTEFFREYETIHPFRDGNGRTGNILFNWMAASLHDPVMPPNLWRDPRRDVRT